MNCESSDDTPDTHCTLFIVVQFENVSKQQIVLSMSFPGQTQHIKYGKRRISKINFRPPLSRHCLFSWANANNI